MSPQVRNHQSLSTSAFAIATIFYAGCGAPAPGSSLENEFEEGEGKTDSTDSEYGRTPFALKFQDTTGGTTQCLQPSPEGITLQMAPCTSSSEVWSYTSGRQLITRIKDQQSKDQQYCLTQNPSNEAVLEICDLNQYGHQQWRFETDRLGSVYRGKKPVTLAGSANNNEWKLTNWNEISVTDDVLLQFSMEIAFDGVNATVADGVDQNTVSGPTDHRLDGSSGGYAYMVKNSESTIFYNANTGALFSTYGFARNQHQVCFTLPKDTDYVENSWCSTADGAPEYGSWALMTAESAGRSSRLTLALDGRVVGVDRSNELVSVENGDKIGGHLLAMGEIALLFGNLVRLDKSPMSAEARRAAAENLAESYFRHREIVVDSDRYCEETTEDSIFNIDPECELRIDASFDPRSLEGDSDRLSDPDTCGFVALVDALRPWFTNDDLQQATDTAYKALFDYLVDVQGRQPLDAQELLENEFRASGIASDILFGTAVASSLLDADVTPWHRPGNIWRGAAANTKARNALIQRSATEGPITGFLVMRYRGGPPPAFEENHVQAVLVINNDIYRLSDFRWTGNTWVPRRSNPTPLLDLQEDTIDGEVTVTFPVANVFSNVTFHELRSPPTYDSPAEDEPGQSCSANPCGMCAIQ